jgi:glucosamine-phosphate N-acetyltransferase
MENNNSNNNNNNNNNFVIRLINKNDYSVVKLLEQFKHNKLNISKEMFGFYVEKGCTYPIDIGTSQLIFVMEDTMSMKIVGHASVIFEHKLLQELRQIAHIEDVIIDDTYRGQKLGKQLIDFIVNYINRMNCYKVILDCNKTNVPFYEKCGFEKKENQMVIYF